MAALLVLLLLTFGSPIVAAMATIALLDRIAPKARTTWWPILAAWWFPLLLLAYGIHAHLVERCEPNSECGGLGEVVLDFLGIASILTGFLVAPFAARRTLRYLRKL